MKPIRIEVTGTTATILENVILTTGLVGQPVQFTFDEAWEGLSRTAVFKAGHKIYSRMDIADHTTIPPEILCRSCHKVEVGVYGYDAEGTVIIPTVWVTLGTPQPGACPTGQVSHTPTLPIWAQLEARVDALEEGGTGGDSSDVEELHVGSLILGSEGEKEVIIMSDAPDTDATGYITAGRLGLYATDDDQPVIMGHLADGTKDNDAATVGQVQRMIEESGGAEDLDEVKAEMEKTVRFIESQTFRVGENLLSDGNVTLGAGWTGNMTDGFTHSKNNTEPLTFAINAADGEKYLISARFGKEVSAIHLTIGDSYPTDPYGTNPFVWGVQSVNGGSLKVTPFDTSWAGTLYELECRKIVDDGAYEISVPFNGLKHGEMANHLSGFWDIQIGRDSLKDSVNTTRCIAIGDASLSSLKSGGRNIGLGTFTLPYMTYGEDNIAIGADSGLYTEEAHACVSIGKSAMSNGRKYKECIAIGHGALYGNANTQDASGNIGIGIYTGYKATIAKNNVFIGSNAGYNITTGNGNVFIGSGAGRAATSYSCIAIGGDADTGEYSQSIAIGAGAKAKKSKQMVLGSTNVTEVVFCGNKKINFNDDGTVTWETLTTS